jgi:hypothetical protein
MSNATTSLLNSCARDLIEIRAQLPSNLEPGIDALFDSVIGRLERGEGAIDRTEVTALIDDGLTLVGRVGKAVLVISEIVDHFRS